MDVTYFESPGRDNTNTALKIAKDYVEKHTIKSIVVASTTGYTAEKAAEIFTDRNLIIVTHVTGFLKKDHQQFPKELKEKMEAKGIKVLTTAHAFGGAGRMFESSVENIVANTLRMLSEGIKVGVEIAVMAADAGLVTTKEDVVAVAGTGRGADTVLVVRPANSRNLFELRVKKILAKPA